MKKKKTTCDEYKQRNWVREQYAVLKADFFLNEPESLIVSVFLMCS